MLAIVLKMWCRAIDAEQAALYLSEGLAYPHQEDLAQTGYIQRTAKKDRKEKRAMSLGSLDG